jgi:single-strand DNA-binding protein
MNKVILMGRLTRDPEMKTANDKQVARYSLAVDRRFSNSEEKTDFLNIVTFGKSAEFAEKYFKKGTKVLVTGRIQTGNYNCFV